MSKSRTPRTEDVLGKAPPPAAIIGPGCATAGFAVWLCGIIAGSYAMTLGALPEWGMFAVLGWPAVVGVPMVLAESRMQKRKLAAKENSEKPQ